VLLLLLLLRMVAMLVMVNVTLFPFLIIVAHTFYMIQGLTGC